MHSTKYNGIILVRGNTMLTNFSFKNYKTFANKVNVSLTANLSIKRFLCNSFELDNRRILKTIGVYGPNNTGKTCLVLALANLKTIMLNAPHEDLTNSFIADNVIHYEVEFNIKKRNYCYIVSYDCQKKEYLEEELSTFSVAPQNNSVKSYSLLIRRDKKGIVIPALHIDEKSNPSIANMISSNYPIVLTINFNPKSPLGIAKKDYLDFANSIILLRLDGNMDLSKTINLMQNDPKANLFISEFIKNCDLHISDFGFSDEVKSDVDISNMIKKVVAPENLKFYSVHKEHRVPSFVFDSLGTQKLIALSGYIYEAIKYGRILIVDEIDSSLHHILIRSIISLFNNELNKKAQLVFSTHDLLLMDLQKMFRKDQIYLTNIDSQTNESYVVHLSDFSSRDESGLRGDEDIVDYYLHGRFGAVPSPELFELLEAATDE